MKKIYKKCLFYLFVMCLFGFSNLSFAQTNIKISGTVKDQTGQALPGVSVRLKDTKMVVATDVNGKYQLEVPNEKSVLEFSYVGFITQQLTVGKKTIFSVVLSDDSKNLNEVVVIGYGQVSRKDLTGSVGSVKMNDLQKAPVRSFEEALAGRVAGVNVTSSDGQPGSPINIVIRGSNSVTQDNSPLYVIDGFPIESPENNSLDPNDIESIEVLKDASATAIYGARGANGVILVTTKRGKEGKTVIAYKGSYGTQEILQRMEVLGPLDYINYQIARNGTAAGNLYIGPATPQNGWAADRTLDYYKDAKGVDWQDRIFRISPMANHSLSISGGTADTKYSLSGSLLRQDGVIINSGYDRKQGKFTIDQNVNKNLKIGMTTNYSILKGFGTIPSELNGADNRTSLLNSAWGYRPITQGNIEDLEEEDTDELFDPTSANGLFNPVASALNQVRNRKSSVLTSNAFAEYKFWKDFKLKISGGITQQTNRNEVFNNSKTRSASPNTVSGRINGVNGSINVIERNSFLNENTLNYTKKINKDHKIDVLAGFTIQGTQFNASGLSSTFIPNESLGLSGIDEGIPSFMTAELSENKLASFLGRVNYSFKSKYLFTASMRSDGSSKFMPANRWSYFPSGSFAWQLGNEPFMKKIKFISDAKLRTSFGVTGNNRVSDFASLPKLSLQPISANVTPYYPFNNSISNGAWPSDLGNNALRWETTEQTNIGLDLSLFANRVSIEVDAYQKVTRDLLLNAMLPPSMGYTSAFKNIGKVGNRGLEFTLNTVNIDAKDFNWSSNFNISFNRNEILGLSENQSSLLTLVNWDNQSNPKWRDIPAYIAKVGQPISQFYGYIWNGNYQLSDFNETSPGVFALKSNVATYDTGVRPGSIKYEDINGDGVIDSKDLTVIGNPNPDFIGGFSNNFRYKGFDLNVFFQFSYGAEVLNANRLQFEGGNGTATQNQFATVKNAWTLENQNNEMFRVGGQGPRAYSSRVIEDGSFLRLKTVSFGYNLPSKYLEKVRVKNLRIYAAAQNLYTWTNYTGLDPEVSAFSSALTPNFDYSVYPRARTITFGLNVSL
jgi:TonB-linked SusC/RagA family outer membrane protein